MLDALSGTLEAHDAALEQARAEERERCKLVVASFVKLSKWWKIAIIGAINNEDWPILDDGREFLAHLNDLREEADGDN